MMLNEEKVTERLNSVAFLIEGLPTKRKKELYKQYLDFLKWPYTDFESEFEDSFYDDAWDFCNWLEEHPDLINFKNEEI